MTAFARVGAAIQDAGKITLPALAYFCIFLQIWSKEAAYSTRFDTTDLSSHLETLIACLALLGGSLSASADWAADGCARIMAVALVVAGLHAALHARVWYWFRGEGEVSRRGGRASGRGGPVPRETDATSLCDRCKVSSAPLKKILPTYSWTLQ